MDEDKKNLRTYQVAGRIFLVWPDYTEHAIYAQDEGNKIQRLGKTGELPVETMVRAAIIKAFNIKQ